MMATEPQAPEYGDATDRGEITERDGWHKPPRTTGYRDRRPSCGCALETDKGAYRDVSVKMPDGTVVHFYHQSPVVARRGTTYRLSSCGYRTATTKERINRHLPAGYRVYQQDFQWYLSTPGDGDDMEFRDGMMIEA